MMKKVIEGKSNRSIIMEAGYYNSNYDAHWHNNTARTNYKKLDEDDHYSNNDYKTINIM